MVGAPIGAIMNSWKSSEFGACAPPLRTLKCGTGSSGATPLGCSTSYSGAVADSARATAMDTPTIALAPRRALLGVPSRAIIAWSSSASDDHFLDRASSRSSPLTFATAVSTPFPPYRALSPSRSSTASRLPVDAPGGDARAARSAVEPA